MSIAEKKPQRSPPRSSINLGEMRTVMAADRTMMAWVRTALAMLSFGFTIYKFLEDFEGKRRVSAEDLPQNIGLFLAAVGTLSIVMGTSEYWSTLKELNRVDRFSLRRPVLLIALVLSCAGVALFVSIAFRLF